LTVTSGPKEYFIVRDNKGKLFGNEGVVHMALSPHESPCGIKEKVTALVK
jgi:hypothetical protein